MIMIAVQNDIFEAFVYSFVISNVTGWLWSLILLSFCFRMKWNKEKKKMDENTLEDKFSVTYQDYEKYKEQEGALDTQVPPPTNQPQGQIISIAPTTSAILPIQQPTVPQQQQMRQQPDASTQPQEQIVQQQPPQVYM